MLKVGEVLMAVLVEGISAVVRRRAIGTKISGGWDRFRSLVPNATLCFDEDLARVGFMDPRSVSEFIRRLESEGLIFLDGEQPVDLVVLDQQRGLTTPCEWIEFMRVKWGRDQAEDQRVGMCWLWEEPRRGAGIHMPALKMPLATPPGWEFEGSLSQQFTFVPDPDS
jgi:hypothetical protein